MMPFSTPNPRSILQKFHPLIKCAGALFCFVLLTIASEKNHRFSIALIVEMILLLLFFGGFRWKQFRTVASLSLFIGCSYLIVYAISPVRPSIAYAHVVFWKWGPITISQASLLLAVFMVLRVLAYLSISLFFLGTTSPEDLLRSLIQQKWLPIRVGYAVLASLRTIPQLRAELEQMRLAQRVRGLHPSRWRIFSSLRQLSLPLLVRSIRRAEQTALSMDARAFGAYPVRTWLRRIDCHRSDLIALIVWVSFHTVLYLTL